MKEILTKNGYVIIVDDADYERAKGYDWRINKDQGNGLHVVTLVDGRYITYKKLIHGFTSSQKALTINGNHLDLRRENFQLYQNNSDYFKAISISRELAKNNVKSKNVKLGGRKKNDLIGDGTGHSYSASYRQDTIPDQDEKISQFTGVYWRHDRKRWYSVIYHNNSSYRLGHFRSEEDAAIAYDKRAIELFGKEARRNFPELTNEELNHKFEIIYHKVRRYIRQEPHSPHQNPRRKHSKFLGVSLQQQNGKTRWLASIMHKTEIYRLGVYNKEEDAAIAYDKKVLELFGKTDKRNYPDLTYEEIIDLYTNIISQPKAKVEKPKKIIGNKGLCFYKNKNLWLAQIRINNKFFKLGMFKDKETAAIIYDHKLVEIYGEKAKRNIPYISIEELNQKHQKILEYMNDHPQQE